MTDQRIYFDSCCFIDLVKYGRNIQLSTAEHENQKRQTDCWFMSRLCDASRDGAIRIVTSALTVAECLHIGEPGGIPSPETKRLIEGFLMSGVVVDLVEPSIFVAEDARNLSWSHGIYLKGADAIHVATALGEKCVEFVTTDEKITRAGSKFSRMVEPITKLGLRVIRGSDTQILPLEYRQGGLEV